MTDDQWNGHAVLQIGVPALEGWIKERAAHYDRRFVSADPGFRHAHISVLAPLHHWDEDALAELAASTPPFRYRLSRLDVFPDGVVYLAPDPEAVFRRLTERAWALMPDVKPFGAPDPTPHLTLDALGAGVTASSTHARVAALLPVTCLATGLELVWYEPNNCHLIRNWRLGRRA